VEGCVEDGGLAGIVCSRARVGAGCHGVGCGRVADSYCWCVWVVGDDVGRVVRGRGVVDLLGSYGDVREVFWVVFAGGRGWVARFGWVVREDGVMEIVEVCVLESADGSRVIVGWRLAGHRWRRVCVVRRW
jgi:hypothetical protein